MSNGEEMINKFTLKEINRIIKLCEPLYRLGITFFYYTHTTANGMCFSIGNMPEVQEEYYRSKLYKISPFFHNSSLIQPGLYSYRCISNPEFQKSMDTLSNAIGLELGVCLVVKRGNELLRFGYASNLFKGMEFLTNIMNNLSILKEFNKYFLNEIQPIIKSNASYLLDLSSDLGVDYNRMPQGLNKITTCHDKASFLDDIGLIKLKKIARLSRREKACLENLRSGLSYREIGDVLKIVTRTVESYIANTKIKLDCDTKGELLKIAELMDKCGHFEFK